ncbi:hypothetical protein NQ315_002302 [Exocentrus adspersus]|uniref:Sulfatase N-terminal domain-containing protein n=1 Tax=Exocentrus adspersus TaxID=1586481 RepID=A0AAV8VTQ8_9CUCU|nr:hypothetical protein NQ315_002302 [Exocentrus adspersus]
MEVDDREAARIHGILSSDSDSDSDSKAQFDEIYYKYKPPPLDFQAIKHKVVEITADAPLVSINVWENVEKTKQLVAGFSEQNLTRIPYEDAMELTHRWETTNVIRKAVIENVKSKHPTMTVQEVKLLEEELAEYWKSGNELRNLKSYIAAGANSLLDKEKVGALDLDKTGAKQKVIINEVKVPVDAVAPVKAKKTRGKKKKRAAVEASTVTEKENMVVNSTENKNPSALEKPEVLQPNLKIAVGLETKSNHRAIPREIKRPKKSKKKKLNDMQDNNPVTVNETEQFIMANPSKAASVYVKNHENSLHPQMDREASSSSWSLTDKLDAEIQTEPLQLQSFATYPGFVASGNFEETNVVPWMERKHASATQTESMEFSWSNYFGDEGNQPSLILRLLHFCFLTAYASSSPNFVVILTDDQDLLLNGLKPMKKTLNLVADTGKVFLNAFVNTPICCPSRSTILTGKYAHNTGVFNNSLEGNCAGAHWQEYHEPHSIAAILKNSKNYTTFYAGKYLNQYGSKRTGGVSRVPRGYDWWIGLKGNSKYYNYTLSINSTSTRFTNTYLTDLLSDYSMEFLSSKPVGRPFFMVVATPAPHAPFIPADRHKGAFAGTKAVRTPSFNHTPVEKHWIVRMPPIHLPVTVPNLDQVQKRRLESLLAVDEMVERIVKKLVALNELNDTYIIFTSDNGFHIGQFAQPWDKRQPYETDIRVPMLITGPNVPGKSLEEYPVTTVDIAPTVLDLAGVGIPEDVDGRSFKAQLLSPKQQMWEKVVLVEYWGEGNEATVDRSCAWKYDKNVAKLWLQECSTEQWCKCQDARNNTYACVLSLTHTQKFKYCSFDDAQSFKEAYDLISDPYELTNVYSGMDTKAMEGYDALLRKYRACKGRDCWL